MLRFLPSTLRGIIVSILMLFNLLMWVALLVPFMIIKISIPFRTVRKPVDFILNLLCTQWASCNRMYLQLVNNIKWDIQGDRTLKKNDWYLVLSNHQSWADIIILQFVLNNRIPYFRFFLKKELVWIPLFNLVWYALDYPYMKRYSKAFLKKHPHLKGKDIETTKKSCERFRDTPVSIMNFVEGTRFTKKKHKKQHSPYQYLLNPKAGGVAFVLSAMGEQLSSILDATIYYDPKIAGFWDFLCGRINEVKVRIEHLPITQDLKGDYFEDEEFKKRFQQRINELWAKKDQTLKLLHESKSNGAATQNLN